MEYCASSPKICIVEGDPDLALSAKCLLESKNLSVEIFDEADEFLNNAFWKITDTVMIDLNPRQPSAFRLLNELLSSPNRPSIIVMSSANTILKPDDIFPGERIKVLFHPINPEDLMQAVKLAA